MRDKTKINSVISEKGDITTDTIKVQKIIKIYHRNFYSKS